VKAMTLQQLSPAIRGLILDGDGVLWKDTAPIGDLAHTFARIRGRGLQVVLATNNATMTVSQYLDKLRGFGVALDAEQIVTSAHATAAALLKAFPQKGAAYIVGEGGVIAALCEAGFAAVTDPEDATPVVAVVVGFDRGLTFQKLSRAMRHVRAGARFYGTNPDVTFPTPTGLIPGAGSIIAAVKAATGVEPVVIGKPAPFMFALCAERMHLEMRETLVVGDRLETDIAGGQAVGAHTALVLTGVSTAAQADAWQPRPDLIAQDLAALVS
jgi:phosphoglycolate/pyridoxal phosphate phosphatase family enzyme